MDALGNPQRPRQTVRKSSGGEVRRLSRQAVALIERGPKLLTDLPEDVVQHILVRLMIAH